MSRARKYYLVAGEASGDLHGANLIKAIKAIDEDADIRCWGGDLMRDAGGELVSHYRERAFMGLWEVIKNIRTISGFLHKAKEDILAWKPDVLVLIDNPGFNMRIAKFAHEKGIPVHYYIAPKVWAWNTVHPHWPEYPSHDPYSRPTPWVLCNNAPEFLFHGQTWQCAY